MLNDRQVERMMRQFRAAAPDPLPEGVQMLSTTSEGRTFLTFSHPSGVFHVVAVNPETGAMDDERLRWTVAAVMALPPVEPDDED